MWQPGADGLCCRPLPALGPGEAPGVDALSIVVVLALRQSLCGQLAAPCNHGIGMWRITTIRYTGTARAVRAKLSGPLWRVSSMLLKGVMRRRQVSKR